jgi:hypothetical protein
VKARVQERARYCDRAMGAARAWPGSPRSRIGHTNKRLSDRLEPIAMEIRSAPPSVGAGRLDLGYWLLGETTEAVPSAEIPA